MNYNVNSVEEYLEIIENDWRKEKFIQLKNMILNIDPNLTLGINYKMLAFYRGEKAILHLNVQKNYVSLYGYFKKFEYDPTLLEPFSIGKGCIRIKKKNCLENTQIIEFLKIQLQ